MSTWSDLTTYNGKVSAKAYYKALSFAAGLVYLFVMTPALFMATLLLRPEHEPYVLPVEVGVALLGNGVVLQAIKEFSGYFDRKSADGNGNPLAKKGVVPPDNASDMMPQITNPNDAL